MLEHYLKTNNKAPTANEFAGCSVRKIYHQHNVFPQKIVDIILISKIFKNLVNHSYAHSYV